ncbi:MAG: tetratricopeptide repeat protein [Bacteroidota bacterium]
MQDYKEYGSLIYNKSRLLHERGDYKAANELLTNAMTYFSQYSDGTIANYYNQLGSIHSNMKDLNQALFYYDKLLEFYQNNKEILNDQYEGYYFHNVANAYYRSEKFDSAEYYFKLALKTKYENTPDSAGFFITYRDLGETYLALGDLERAELNLLEAQNYLRAAMRVDNHHELRSLLSELEQLKGNCEYRGDYQEQYAKDIKAFMSKGQRLVDISRRYQQKWEEEDRLANEKQKQQLILGFLCMIALIGVLIALYFYRKNKMQRDLLQIASRHLSKERVG